MSVTDTETPRERSETQSRVREHTDRLSRLSQQRVQEGVDVPVPQIQEFAEILSPERLGQHLSIKFSRVCVCDAREIY